MYLVQRVSSFLRFPNYAWFALSFLGRLTEIVENIW